MIQAFPFVQTQCTIFTGMSASRTDFDAVIVGSGPNGLSAAITLQQQGLSVLVLEAMSTIGGGMRTAELTLPGFKHDVCSAIHPLAISSPFFKTLPLQHHGLEFIVPPLSVAHPFDDGRAVSLHIDISQTARTLGEDEDHYKKLADEITRLWPLIDKDVLAPLSFPADPIALSQFGLKAIQSATRLSKKFSTQKAKGFWAGLAAHSMLPLDYAATSAIGLVLLASAHANGWPIAKGGSQSIANALASYFVSIGGKIEVNKYVKSLTEIPSAKAILFDIGPAQLLQIAGHKFSTLYRSQLQKYRYGMGVFKIDWALDAPIPFRAKPCASAGTVHVGGSFEEIAASERAAWQGRHVEKPFVLLAQQSLFDSTRVPEGKQAAWGYCHVPGGSTKDMTALIENQIERFAPGFKDRILARHTFNCEQMEHYNPNYVGGDINGGSITLDQLFTRPALRLSPYRTSAKGLYLCSSSTPPGGGVHGMCGYHAARRALNDIFNVTISL
jgi:phytoene dehydrogenase-like protein